MARSCPSPPVDCTRSEVVVLEGLSWSTFEAILAETGDARHSRLSYDRGRMAIVSPSWIHERAKKLLGQLVMQFCLAQGRRYCSAGSVTLTRAASERAVEADETFYVVAEHVEAVRGRRQLDLETDPPPDLVVEIDVSRDSTAKLAVYASIRVAEVWLISPDTWQVTLHCLRGEGYEIAHSSRVLPGFPLGDATSLLARLTEDFEDDLLREFVERVRAAD